LTKVVKNGRPRPKRWLDAGAGTGLVATVADKLEARHHCDWLLKCKVRAAFDYAPGMLQVMRALSKSDANRQSYTSSFDADLRTITAETLRQHTGEHCVDLITANNVLHWLFRGNAIYAALRRCRDLLQDGGLLAASVAAVGTGSHFLSAYQAEMSEALDESQRDKWASHIKNPIGLQQLNEIVLLARKAGFAIEAARQVYEPRTYIGGSDEYVTDARSYGEAVYMAPLLGATAERREEVWGRIKRRFRDLYSTLYSEPRYVHDQHMIYLIARKLD
jgi:SAM-dependent methyltransferase